MKRHWLLPTLILAVLTFSLPALLAQKARGDARTRNQKEDRPTRIKAVLNIGDEAPDFTLLKLESVPETGNIDETSKITLSSFRGKTPVVLIFSSYT